MQEATLELLLEVRREALLAEVRLDFGDAPEAGIVEFHGVGLEGSFIGGAKGVDQLFLDRRLEHIAAHELGFELRDA